MDLDAARHFLRANTRSVLATRRADGAPQMSTDLYRRLRGEHPDWDGCRTDMASEQRRIIQLTVERAGPDRHG